jgi:hypothetical protein
MNSLMLEDQEGTTLAFYSEDADVAIWWNNSATFNVWQGGQEVEVFTNYSASSVHQACQIAQEWFREGQENDEYLPL